MTGPSVRHTTIPGLLVLTLPLHVDRRGWFKENWQRARMVDLGLPDFGPVQNNMAHNTAAGSTRGLHAEPWDKLVSVGNGRVFGAWVDLRRGDGFGALVTLELGPDTAVFVPRGVANGYQTLEPGTVYSYLVNQHWTPSARNSSTYLNLADPTIAIGWPIPLDAAEVSEADRAHPQLTDVVPVAPRRTAVVGAGGQLGRALMELLPQAQGLERPEFDLLDEQSIAAVDWSQVGTLVNAAAWTAVDAAETQDGRRACWDVNVTGLSRLVEVARTHHIPLVHLSSDYVFDGTAPVHTEDEPLSPLGVYGQTKAAGEALVATLPRYWIVRTSWLVGEGHNFVRTMSGLADRGVAPRVVGDQSGRLSFAPDVAAGILHLITQGSPSGIYHLTNSGPTQSWADVARAVFALRGRNPQDVTEVSATDHAVGRQLAPRPAHSTMDLAKITATGFTPAPAEERLRAYVAQLTEER